jgi:hypothetical protein
MEWKYMYKYIGIAFGCKGDIYQLYSKLAVAQNLLRLHTILSANHPDRQKK